MRLIAEVVGIVAGVLTIAAFFARWLVNRKRAEARALEQRDRQQLPPGDDGGGT